jgi:hypothetical protein
MSVKMEMIVPSLTRLILGTDTLICFLLLFLLFLKDYEFS